MAPHFSAALLVEWLPWDVPSCRKQTAQVFLLSSISEGQVSVLTLLVDPPPWLRESRALETREVLPAFHLQCKLARCTQSRQSRSGFMHQ